MAESNIWSQTRYLAPFKYVLDSNIVELDIEKANINVLRYYNAIDDDTYTRLYNLPKYSREKRVGWMIKRMPQLSNVLREGIQDARHKLFDILQLDSSNVLAVNNDAVFVIFSGPTMVSDIQINDLIKFKVKGQYRSFYYLNKKQFYYTYNPITCTEGLDIKGVGEYGIKTCSGFLRLLCDLFYSYLNGGANIAYNNAIKLYEDYMNKKFPIDFYRRLDSHARYDIYNTSNYASFQVETLEPNAIGAVNPAYNMNMIRLLISYYAEAVIMQT